MKLNDEHIRKFNKLLYEVAEYYNISDKIVRVDSSGMSAIKLESLGLGVELPSMDGATEFLRERWPYLIPFYFIWKAYMFPSIKGYQVRVTHGTFDEINWVIKFIRKEKVSSDEVLKLKKEELENWN